MRDEQKQRRIDGRAALVATILVLVAMGVMGGLVWVGSNFPDESRMVMFGGIALFALIVLWRVAYETFRR